MKRTLIAPLLFLALQAVAQVPDSTVLHVAGEHLKAGRCKDVLRTLAPLLERDPPSNDALVLRANCRLRRTEEYEAGMDDLQQVLQREPTHFKALMLRSDVFEDMRMYPRAEEDLVVAVDHAPDTAGLVRALNRRTWVRIQVRSFPAARADAERVLSLDSVNENAYNNLGIILEQLGDTSGSFAMLRRYLTLAPEDAVAHANMGFFLSEAGRYNEALTYFDQAEALGKADARFFNNRGFARLGSGDARGAKKDIERSLKMDPSNAYAYRNLAHVCFALDDTAGGCEALEKALAKGFTKQYGNEVQEMRRARCH